MKQWSVWFANLLLLTACNDSIRESPVPAGYVRYSCVLSTINLVMEQGNPQIPVDAIGGYVRCFDPLKRTALDGWGTGGLLLVHGFEGDNYYAYDLACPYCYTQAAKAADKVHRLVIESDGQTAYCPDCSSKFGAIFWGSPIPTEGPANQENYLLRQYKATLSGDRLIITNR